VESGLDIKRLAELQGTLGVGLPEIVATLMRELDDAVSEAEAAVAAGDLAAAALAAHTGRNSALMIGASPVLGALGELEAAGGGEDPAAARAALEQLRSSWPALRGQLEVAGRSWK
jgi:hypothetical protein